MSLTVSSWYLEQSRATASAPLRRFTLGGSDYSESVLRWPTLRFHAGTIDLGTTTVHLSNMDRAFQCLVDCPVQLTAPAELSLGFAHPDSGAEYVSLYQGAPAHAAFESGGTELRLQLQGKTRRLSDAALGSATESGGLDFTTSASFPSDLAWTLLTVHGGLSAEAGSANPDIDVAEWQAWRDADVVRDVRVRAYLTGERIYQVLDALARMDSRVISFRNGRLHFRDAVEPYESTAPAFPVEAVLDSALSLDPARLVNHFFVEAAYDTAKAAFTAQYTKVHSASEALFGRHSARFSSPGVWFSTGGDARYLAEDRVRFGHTPKPLLRVQTPLAGGLEAGVGEVFHWTDSGLGIANAPYRVLEQAIDLEHGRVELVLEAAQRRPWQRVGSVASHNLYVRDLALVGSGPEGPRYAALVQTFGTSPLLVMDSAGFFRPAGAYGTTLRALPDGALLLGGPPNSGGFQGVLQRAAQADAPPVTVHSLFPSAFAVYEIYPARSGTVLASTESGGIWRSTDAGSSWALTQTISSALHVNRFFEPRSGTLWGGTEPDDFFDPLGLHVWESLDDGVSWQPRHTVYSSGSYRTAGWHALSDSAWLLAHTGLNAYFHGVLRVSEPVPGQLQTTLVHSAAAFAAVHATASGHLLFGYDEPVTLDGGVVFRSTDGGESWSEDARLAKQGNIRLVPNPDGTLDAFVTRMTMGSRTDRYRNFEPDEIT